MVEATVSTDPLLGDRILFGKHTRDLRHAPNEGLRPMTDFG